MNCFICREKKQLLQQGDGDEVVIMDVTEHTIERPKKKQRRYYSGKKHKHSLKAQLVAVNEGVKTKIICVAIGEGKTHDFKLYKQSGIHIHKEKEVLVDKGYLGIQQLHGNSRIPKKSSKNHSLTKQEKSNNKTINQKRIVIEHVNRKLKVFKILGERYRNRRRRFGLRINLICAILNHEL